MKTKNLKQKLLLFLALIMTVGCCLALSACGDTASEIYFTSSNSPKLTYVQGQDLDLSIGALTVKKGEEENLVPLNTEGVSVTGYDKNTMGDQTVTVSYLDCTTTFKVTVVARMTVEGFVDKYFVNDKFDASAGKVRIANDSGTFSSVNMNDSKISLVSFDSSKAGTTAVTVKYTDGSGSYECSFNVNVYEIESVSFTEPKNTSYLSHNDKLDFTKGYLTVKANGGTFVKYIDLTEDMISGKDFSKAGPEHRETPLEQTLTVTYGNFSTTFKITIKYSGISIINDAFESLSTVDMTNVAETLTEQQGEIAVDAANEYFKLAGSEKKLLDSAKVKNLMVCASIHGMTLYEDSLDDFSKVFSLEIQDDMISVNFVFNSDYDVVVSEMARIKNPQENINVYAPILRNIRSEFATLMITEDKNAEQYLFVHTEENQKLIVDIFEHFIEIYDLLADIPDDWTDADLEANSDNILIAVTRITGAELSSSYLSLYNNILSPWREKNDVFDILYYYYLYLAENSDKFLKDTMWDQVPLPIELAEWGVTLSAAVDKIDTLINGSDTYLNDITYFMYARKLAYDVHEKMKEIDNQFYRDLLEFFDIDYIIQHDMNSFGYYKINGSNSFSEKLNAVWDAYLKVYELGVLGELKVEGNEQLFKDMLDAFLALSPTETYAFLRSLNYQYGDSLGSVKVLDYTYDAEKDFYTTKNVFCSLLALYDDEVLGDELSPVFKKLLYAIESYAVLGERYTALEDFNGYIEELNTAFSSLSDENKALFKSCVGDAYDKYLEIYAAVNDGVEIDLSESPVKSDIDAFISKVELIREIADFISGLDKEKDLEAIYAHRILVSAIFEHADVYYANIMTQAANDPTLMLALYTNLYEIGGESFTLAKAYAFATDEHDEYMFKQGISVTYGDDASKYYTVWEYYEDSIKGIVKLHADLLYASYKKDFSDISPEYVAECIASMVSPTGIQYNLLKIFYGDTLIYDAYNAYFKTILGNDEATILYAKRLLEAHTAYYVYHVEKQELKNEAKQSFISACEKLQSLDKSEVEEEFFETYLKAMFDYVNEKHDALENGSENE